MTQVTNETKGAARAKSTGKAKGSAKRGQVPAEKTSTGKRGATGPDSVVSAPRTRTITLAPGTEVTAMIAGAGRDAVILSVGMEGAWVQFKPGFISPDHDRQFVAWEDMSVCADQSTGGESEGGSQAVSAGAMDTPGAIDRELRIVAEIADMLILQPEAWLEGFAFRLRGALQKRTEPATD